MGKRSAIQKLSQIDLRARILVVKRELYNARMHFEFVRDLDICWREGVSGCSRFPTFFLHTYRAHWNELLMSLWRIADPAKRRKVGIEWLNEYAKAHLSQFRYMNFECLRMHGASLLEEVTAELGARREQLVKLNHWRQHVLGHLDESVCVRDKFANFIEKNYPPFRDVEDVLDSFCEVFNALSQAHGNCGCVPRTSIRICHEAELMFRALPHAEQSRSGKLTR